MKKVLFWLSLILGLLVLNTVPSFAMEFPVSPDMIGGLGDLGYGLLGGATFDFNDSIYAVDNWDNLTQELKDAELDAKAKLFLGDYCVRRGIPFEDINPDLPTDAKSFYKSQYFSSNTRTAWNKYKLANSIEEQEAALRFPISPQAFSDWTGYSNFWYKKYIDQLSQQEEIITNLPEDYLYLNDTNDFIWNNTNINTVESGQQMRYYSSSYNICFQYPFNCTFLSYIEQQYNFQYGRMIVSTLGDIDITENANDVTVTYTNFNLNFYSDYNQKWIEYIEPDGTYQDYLEVAHTGRWMSSQSITALRNLRTSFNTLDDALDYIVANFRHFNLKVNGDAWIICDTAPANPVIPDFNDIMGGDDEDPYPAYDVILPDTTDNYGTFDITSLFDLIRQKIADASDSDPTTDGVLSGDDVADTFKDRTGEAVDEEDVPIDDILDDSFPYEDTDNYPNLPEIPLAPLDDAFQGTTILSELIDATQQILPEPLALAFWGMVFILFILGLIKILHK